MRYYNAGYVYVNIPHLACDYISGKSSYKRFLVCAKAALRRGCKDDYHSNMNFAKHHHRECGVIMAAIRLAGKKDEFIKMVALLEDIKRSGGNPKEIMNAYFGLHF